MVWLYWCTKIGIQHEGGYLQPETTIALQAALLLETNRFSLVSIISACPSINRKENKKNIEQLFEFEWATGIRKLQ